MRLAPTPRAQRTSRATFIGAIYGALLAAAIGIGALRSHPNVFVLSPDRGDELRMLAGAPIGLAIGLIAVVLTRLAVRRLDWARALHQEFHALVHGMRPREILLLALTSSVAEEAFFRGALLPVVGLWVQAIVFAALHFRPRPRFYPWTLMSLGVGLGFGLLARWLGDLSAPIVAHFTINLLNLSYISRTELRA
jgi:membrane protease YdiL (CAAX protease family)